METKVGETKGFAITYDGRDRLFRLKDGEGNEVGSGETQDAVEGQAVKLVKRAFSFPIPALIKDGVGISLGRVTSVNIGDKFCTFVYSEEGHYCSKTRVHFAYTKLFALTPLNEVTRLKIVAKMGEHKQIEDELKTLVTELEKPLNLDYFSPKESS